MLHMSIPTGHVLPAGASLVVAAVRSWHEARRRELPVQQHIYQTLAPHDCGMLAPVLDSLIRFFETTRHRPLSVGSADALTPDEQTLVEILQGTDDNAPPLASDGSLFRDAVWSARIMIRKVLADALHLRAREAVAFA